MASNATLSDYLNFSSKTSTFVSIDVAGSTALKDGENEQEIIYTFLAYHKLVSDRTYGCHGEVISITGDGMMCRFQRAEDAASLVESILTQLPTFNKRQNRLSRPLTLRLGVHTGAVYENQSIQAGQWISRTIDVAAKLQQSAPSDSARLSEATINELKSRPGSYRRIGWDASLGMNIYEYQSRTRAADSKKALPDPVRSLAIEHELDEIVRLKKVLWGRRYESLTVYNQNQAALCIAAWSPHLILLSADLPWETGWESLLTFRSDEKLSRIPIIMISRQTTGGIIQKAFGMGANGFLSKPLEDRQIIKRVEMVLRESYL